MSMKKDGAVPTKRALVAALMMCLSLVWAMCTGCSTTAGDSVAASEDPNSTRPEDHPALMLPAHTYKLAGSVEVDGRQGVCCEGDYYWVSGSTSLTKYDRDWKVVAQNLKPFEGYDAEVNHIGDIDVHNNELYVGVEYFMDGVGKNIQIALRP